MTEQRDPGSRPDLVLVQRLLDALLIPGDAARLHDAADRVEQGSGGHSCTQWLREVFIAAEVKELSPLLIPWQRFDPRRLPVLLHHRGTWYLAERAGMVSHAAGASDDDAAAGTAQASPGEKIRLISSDGRQSSATMAELDGAEVLWLRQPPSRSGANTDALTGNLATRLVWRELFRERGWLWQIVAATCLVNLIGISTALFAMQVYDRVVPTMAYATLTTLVAGMAIVVVVHWLLGTIRARILDALACAVDERVSQQVFEHLLKVRLDAQPRSLGTLAAQIGGLETVRQFFSAAVVFALVDLPFALMFLAFIGIIGGAVAWVYALLLPAALILGFVTQWRLRVFLRNQLSRINERQGLLVDTIRGAESIRANNAGWRFAREWQEITASINRFAIQQRAIGSFSMITTTSLSTLAYVLGVVVGVWQIEAGLLTMGGLIACSILGGRIIAPVAQSVQHLVQWQHVRQALDLVHQVLALESERRDDVPMLLPAEAPDAIALDSVRFAYPDSPVRQLDIAKLRLESGDRVLLVGPVGAGKSTLLKVLAGLYRPGEGRIRLGQADLWETDPLVVGAQIGYLPQSVQLFRGTLRSNLCLTGTASDDRLLEISRQLGIDAIAEGSPLGMEAPISEGGEGLSGGQRQLVALARLFINQPRIWLLDEPTASLDRELEETVWHALETHLAPTDILVVSTHRPLLASRLVNRVVILQQGRVVRDGKPEALLPALAGARSLKPAGNTGKADAV